MAKSGNFWNGPNLLHERIVTNKRKPSSPFKKKDFKTIILSWTLLTIATCTIASIWKNTNGPSVS